MLHRRLLISALTLIAACALLFYDLGADPLHSWDEAVYAESAKEMVQDGDWLTPHWNHEKFLQKPPLFIWSTALSFKLFGVSETSARAMSALAGVGCVVLTLLIVRLFAAEFTAVIAALILLATPSFYLNARYAMTDVMLTFFMLLTIYAYLRTTENTKWWLLVGVSCGLAVMTKGAGAIPLFVGLLIVIAWKDRAAFRRRDLWLGVGLCLVVAGTWHLTMLVLHGRPFVSDYFSSQVVSRTLRLMDSPEGQYGAFYYIPIVVLGFFPACLLLPLSIPSWLKERRLPIILPLFAATMLILYSLASTKHQWYMIPVFPIFAIIAAPLRKQSLPVYLILIAIGILFSLTNGPSKQTLAIAELSHRASMDAGPLGFYPGFNYGPEILFYSNRQLCANAPEHSMGQLAKCSKPEYAIVAKADILPNSTELARSGDFVYCRVSY
jgi:4-amino-4-deoxy-L-arabinose transferase-like glycosyltransferase